MDALARLLFEVGQLQQVRRSGWWLTGVIQPESVAEHSHRAAVVAFTLASLEGADPDRAATLAVLHDLAETRLGDAHHLTQKYLDKSAAERVVGDDQTDDVPAPAREALRARRDEYAARDTLEARVAKDADRLDCLLKALEYRRQGHPVDDWIDSSQAGLHTESARRLADAILATPPDAWHRREEA